MSENDAGTDDQNTQDLKTVSDVLRGNPAAFEDIVNRYQGVVLRLARRYLGDEQDAADAAQEIFLKTYRALALFSLERRFMPWLYGIALNHLRSSYRRIKPWRDRKQAIAEPQPDQRNDPAAEALKRTEQERVRSEVMRLPNSLREVVVLYYLEELSVAEVSEVLSLSRENVKSRLHRARNLLRKTLAE